MRRRATAFAFAAIVVGAVISPAPARADALFMVVSGRKYHDLQHRAAKAEADARSAREAYGREHEAYLRERERYEDAVAQRRQAEHQLAAAKARLAQLSGHTRPRVVANADHRKAKRKGHHAKLAGKPHGGSHRIAHQAHHAQRPHVAAAKASHPAEPVHIAVAPRHVSSHPTPARRPEILGWGQP